MQCSHETDKTGACKGVGLPSMELLHHRCIHSFVLTLVSRQRRIASSRNGTRDASDVHAPSSYTFFSALSQH